LWRAKTFLAIFYNEPGDAKRFPQRLIVTKRKGNLPRGAKVMRNQIHTYFKTQIKAAPYSLSQIRIEELNEELLLGVGIIKTEDLKS